MALQEPDPNPRAIYGHNSGAADKDQTYTIEEAKIVYGAVRYLQWRIPDLEDLLVKRKGGRIMGWRLLLAWALKPYVRLVAVHQLLLLNRKTAGENQQRPEIWASMDDETSELFTAVKEAIYYNGKVEPERTSKLLKDWVKIDPQLRELEERQRDQDRQAALARTAADKRESRVLAKALQQEIIELKANLRGANNKRAVVAKHMGARYVAAKLKDEAGEVIRKMGKAEKKGVRRKRSELEDEYGDYGLRMCEKDGLIRVAESFDPNTKRAADPQMALTPLGAQVYAEIQAAAQAVKRTKRSA